MRTKEDRIHIRSSTELVRRLNAAATIIDRPKSQIIREALDEKLAKLAKQYPQHKDELAPAA